MRDVMYAEIGKLMIAFPEARLEDFSNGLLWFNVHRSPKVSSGFRLSDCDSHEDVVAKVFEWLSRDAVKGQPFTYEKTNEKYREYVHNGICRFVGKRFERTHMLNIYEYLGNRINHQRTLDFILNEYDVDWLLGEVSG